MKDAAPGLSGLEAGRGELKWPLSALPDRVRVLILGGGIHGVGLLHDLASRGWHDIHLVERHTLGFGTSSRSTKLIHGGLRYLQNIRDFGLVAESLRERRTLMRVAGDIVKPLELIFPVLKQGGVSRPVIKMGLTLYDLLSGQYGLEKHHRLTPDEVSGKAPPLALDRFRHFYSFHDCQTDDLELVRRVSSSAVRQGGSVSENCEAIRIEPGDDGWLVTVRRPDGKEHVISALYVFNALGPWAHKILENSRIAPTHRAVNNRGSHVIVKDMGLKSGLFLQSPEDGRIFFMLPWLGHTILGTTEDRHSGDPDEVHAEQKDVDYILGRANRYLKSPLSMHHIEATFSGLRWLALEEGHTLTATSRNHIIGEHSGRRGLLMTLYGGKLSAYRALCQEIGDRITAHFGEFKPSRTSEIDSWVKGTGHHPETAITRFVKPVTANAI